MRTFAVLIVATMAMASAACGGRTTPGHATSVAALTSGSVIFYNRDDGKDADSAVTVELLRNNSELAAEARAVGTHWEHDTTSAPISMSVAGAFRKNDLDSARLRIRLTPDGRDTWTFDTKLTVMFSDGGVQNFFWRDVRLDQTQPERILPLGPARIP